MVKKTRSGGLVILMEIPVGKERSLYHLCTLLLIKLLLISGDISHFQQSQEQVLLCFISPTYLQTPCQSTAQVLGTVAYFFYCHRSGLGTFRTFFYVKTSHEQFTLLRRTTLPVFFKVNWKALTINIHVSVWASQHNERSLQSIHCNFILCFLIWQYHGSVLLPQSKKWCI